MSAVLRLQEWDNWETTNQLPEVTAAFVRSRNVHVVRAHLF